MSSKLQKTLGILFLLLCLVGAGYYLFKKNIGTINIPSKAETPAAETGEVVSFLKTPPRLQVTFYAKNVPGARVMAFDQKGRMLVSQTSEDKISIIENSTPRTLISGLSSPHGLAFDCRTEGGECHLYVAESNAL